MNYEDVIKGKGITLPSNDPGTLDKTVLRSLIGILANPYGVYVLLPLRWLLESVNC